MECAFAIFSTLSGRMAITGADMYSSYYGVYQVPMRRQFPVPPAHHGIHMSPSQIKTDGTYVVAYCSAVINLDQIMVSVTENLEQIDPSHEMMKSADIEAEDQCLKAINYRLNTLDHSKTQFVKYITTKQLLKSRCRERDIISLAYQKKIGIAGEFACFAPKSKNHDITIIANRSMRMNQFLFEDPKILRAKMSSNTYALAWFRGYLYCFERTRSDSNGDYWWKPLTAIGDDPESERLISGYVRNLERSIADFVDTMKVFKELLINSNPSDNKTPEFPNRFDKSKGSLGPSYDPHHYESIPNLHQLPGYLVFRQKNKNGKYMTNFSFSETSKRDKNLYHNTPIKFDDVQPFKNQVLWNSLRHFKIPAQSEVTSPAAKLEEEYGEGWLCH
ncbi:putative effector protein [Blumeria hordei DH14]|uniref:Putative effector protein n=1 Tax=Blumeria graminis f. sp. hordei (strain DH14) TaxID=546991 RepID=N1JKH0_BLUG1|nr:putative effector protein [Blumeria hordei DH14]